jgi:hypothetical protein
MTKMKWVIIGGIGLGVFALCALLSCLILGTLTTWSTSLSFIPADLAITPTPILREIGLLPTSTPRASATLQPPNTSFEPILREYGCLLFSGTLGQVCYASIENPTDQIIVNSSLSIHNYDLEGISLGGTVPDLGNLFPGEIRKVVSLAYIPENSKFGSYTIQIVPPSPYFNKYVPVDLVKNPFSVSGIELAPNNLVIATIENSLDKSINMVKVCVVLFDEDGAFAGGGGLFASRISPHGKLRVEVPVLRIGEVSRIEVYPSIPGDAQIR